MWGGYRFNPQGSSQKEDQMKCSHFYLLPGLLWACHTAVNEFQWQQSQQHPLKKLLFLKRTKHLDTGHHGKH